MSIVPSAAICPCVMKLLGADLRGFCWVYLPLFYLVEWFAIFSVGLGVRSLMVGYFAFFGQDCSVGCILCLFSYFILGLLCHIFMSFCYLMQVSAGLTFVFSVENFESAFILFHELWLRLLVRFLLNQLLCWFAYLLTS